MNEGTSIFRRSYSFLAWLIAPVLLAWFGTNYILGAITTNPQWARALGSQAASPVVVVYPPIERGQGGMVTFWFDDAWKSQYLVAAPILKDAGMAAAIAVPASYVGYDAYLNWSQLQALQQEGWEITNHSNVHDCAMQNWSADRMDTDFTDALEAFQSHHLASEEFVSPCGVSSPALVAEAQKYFSSFRGVDPGYNDLNALDTTNLKVRNVTDSVTVNDMRAWITEAHKNNLWLILVFHQIGTADVRETSVEEKYATSVDAFRAVVSYIKSTGMRVVVPAQALAIATTTI